MNYKASDNDLSEQKPLNPKPGLSSQSGASLVEYALLITLLVLMAIPAVGLLGEGVRDKLDDAAHLIEAGGSFNCGEFPLPPC